MIEKLKNLLLVFLGLLMCLLFGINLTLGLDTEDLSRLGLRPRQTATGERGGEAALLPSSLAIRGPSGLYLAAGEEYDTLLAAVNPILTEALGSVSEIRAITEAQFLEALGRGGITMHFTYAVPFSMVQHLWTGETGFSSEQAVTTMAVAAVEEQVVLVFRDGQSGRCWQATTAAGYERLQEQCASAPIGNAFYAFERDGYQMLAPCEMVWNEAVYYPTWQVTRPDLTAEETFDQGLLAVFDINPFLAEVYKESSGERSYIESYVSLRFGKEGQLRYSATGEAGLDLELPDGLSEKERRAWAARRAHAVIEEAAAAAGCADGYSVAGTLQEGTDRYVVFFEQMLGGGFVIGKNGRAATAVIEGGRVVDLRLDLCSYAAAERTMLLPMSLAISLLDEEEGRLCVRYTETEGLLRPGLYSMKGGGTDGMEPR